ncbi:NAD(P)H-binding protein [Streptomyces sp. NA04227]|uniref:SDR family oxidoreductase n=1 Tax=Streptomyces sp. NA04227 TaxID=2742136 RepID=UPI001590ECD2|nr:NAD(P)H-binding protein [Streptomyces sp. NA04227]QKW09979.1 NAD(P)H-binding protein [Streptomyces sp. NA04227]
MTQHSDNTAAVQRNEGTKDAARQADGVPAAALAPGATVLVTSATGKTGRRVVEAATTAGFTVRAASRKGPVVFDWHDPATWPGALEGAEAAYLCFPPDIGHPAAAGAIGALARQAVTLGVRRLVLLSARGEQQALPAEEALTSSGADWTVVRASWFAQNFSEGPLLDAVRAGELVFPAGEVREPFLDTRDLAEVVVAAFRDPGLVGRVVEIGGPRLLSFRDAVAEIAAASGNPVSYVPVPPHEYGEQLRGFGVPEEEVGFLIELFGDLLDGRNAHLSDGLRQVLGHEGRDFAAFAKEHAAEGVWRH